MLSLAQRKSSLGLSAAQQWDREEDFNQELHRKEMQTLNIRPYQIKVFNRQNQTNGKDFLPLRPKRCELKTAIRSARTFNFHLSNPCWASLINLNS